MRKRHLNGSFKFYFAATLIVLGLAAGAARGDGLICRGSAIVDANGRELFVEATSRAKRVIGTAKTHDPTRLKAMITVDDGMFFIYSNFVNPGLDFPTKIATTALYDLESVALDLVGPDGAADAFEQMTFYVDQRVLDHPSFARLRLDLARNVWIVDRNGATRRWREPEPKPPTPFTIREPEREAPEPSPYPIMPEPSPRPLEPPKPVEPLKLSRAKTPQVGKDRVTSAYEWPKEGQAIKMHLDYPWGNRLDVLADNGVRFPLWHFADEVPELDLSQQLLLKHPWVISTDFYLPGRHLSRLLTSLRGLPVSFALSTQFNESRVLERYHGRRDWQWLDVVVGEKDGAAVKSTEKVVKHGRVALDILRNLSAGSPDGRRLTFLVWHQGLDRRITLKSWLDQIRSGAFLGHHLALLGCPVSEDGFFQLQHNAIEHGSRSCVMPTEEVNLPAATLAAVMLSRHPELLDGATPLEALRRGYAAAGVPLADALKITNDSQALDRLKADFGERGVDFFRRDDGSLDRATGQAILDGLRGDPGQFIECVDGTLPPHGSVRIAEARRALLRRVAA